MTQDAPELPGRTWVGLIGSGGFADVHLYREENPPRDLAVKVLRDASDAAGRAALGREAAALAAVAGHPAVVSLIGVGESADGRPWLAMEHCPVTDLAARAKRGPLPLDEVLDTVVAVAAGAEALHRAGYVHRDIKPVNVLHTRWGRPVLADLGASLAVGATPDERAAGFSPAWSPPEQHAGADAHPTQDVWGLAATCWSLLTGRSPFEIPGGDNTDAALMARSASGAFGGLGRADCPPELEAVLRRALALSPTQRTPTASALATGLQDVQESLGRPRTRFEAGAPLSSAPADAPVVRTLPPASSADPDATRPSLRVVDPRGAAASEETIVGPHRTPGTPPAAGTPAARASAVPTTPAPEGAPPSGRPSVAERVASAGLGPRPWVVGLLVAVVALVAVAATVGILFAQGVQPNGPVVPSSTATAKPLDPVAAPPTPIADAQGEVRGGKVVWTWRPSTEQGVRYQVTTTRPGAEPASQRTTFTTLEVEASKGQNCLSVVAVNKEGRPSAPLERCVTVP